MIVMILVIGKNIVDYELETFRELATLMDSKISEIFDEEIDPEDADMFDWYYSAENSIGLGPHDPTHRDFGVRQPSADSGVGYPGTRLESRAGSCWWHGAG